MITIKYEYKFRQLFQIYSGYFITRWRIILYELWTLHNLYRRIYILYKKRYSYYQGLTFELQTLSGTRSLVHNTIEENFYDSFIVHNSFNINEIVSSWI